MSIAAKCTCGSSFSYCNGDDRCEKKMPVFPDFNIMDIRTQIATQVLNGLISHYGGSNPDSNAKMAIENADALIKRLNEE